MAVQSQYPYPAFKELPNDNASFEDVHQHYNHQQDHNITPNLFGGDNNFCPEMLNENLPSDPESALTCNMSGSRKRNRLDYFQIAQPENQMINPLQISQLGNVGQENRLRFLAGTSRSGRTSMDSPYLVCTPSQDLNSNLLFQNLDIEALIQLQNGKLGARLEEMRKRHCKLIVSILEKQVVKKLEEKETELVNVKRMNKELEEMIKQMSAENQIWLNVAKNNEAMASSLRSSLEQILLQNQSYNQINEGFGDSDGIANDAQSSCNEDESKPYIAEEMIRENSKLKKRICCKVCLENEISVLLLPCRHLCLCKQCEPKINSCPICKSSTNESLQVFIT